MSQGDLAAVARPLDGLAGFAVTVDVEEWFHTCLVPTYVDPQRRPPGLAEELDFLLPEVLDIFDRADRRATFFVLGETARRWPARIREIVAAGHEVACHGDLHLRAVERPLADFVADVRRSKELLEDLTGKPVVGFRAPEWSLRRVGHPGLRAVADLGFVYDSSLAPFAGAGRRSNPRRPVSIAWPDRPAGLIELPPLVWGGPLRLPAGSWTGRLARPARIAAAARRQVEKGAAAVIVVHPWELSGRPTPGALGRGLARLVHETGRLGYRERFEALLASAPWRPVSDLLGALGKAGARDGADEPDRSSVVTIPPPAALER